MTSTHDQIFKELGISQNLIEERNLKYFSEATELELTEIGEDGKEHYLTPEASRAWKNLKGAARSDGVEIYIVSGYRSITRQVEIIRGKLEMGMEIIDILKVCAPPGCSEHHTGRAVDLSTPDSEILKEEFENTSAFQWLEKNAKEFSYYMSYPRGNHLGYCYEPWHWRYYAT